MVANMLGYRFIPARTANGSMTKFKFALICSFALTALCAQGQDISSLNAGLHVSQSAMNVAKGGNFVPALAALLPVIACFCSMRERRRR